VQKASTPIDLIVFNLCTMKKITLIIATSLAILLGLRSNNAFASHAAGMEIYYRHITGNTYEFTIIYYNNNNGIGAPNTQPLYAGSSSLGVAPTVVATLAKIGFDNPPNLLNCTNNNSLSYSEHTYRGTVNLNTLSATPYARDWVFYTQVGNRPGGVWGSDNIQNPTAWLHVDCGLNNKDFPGGNDSPFWHTRFPNHPGHTKDTVVNYLFRTMCADNFYTFDQSVVEYEGDTVTYEFAEVKGFNGVIVPYRNPPYSLTNIIPHKTPPGFNIDRNGIINVNPNYVPGQDIFSVGIKATEWRMDTIVVNSVYTPVMKEIGFVFRDMTLYIDGPNTCRKDYVHPFVNRVDCGDSILTVKFRSAPNEPSRVRCETISPDGSEFRLVDSSQTPPRSIAILNAQWVCGSGNNTSAIKLPLAERLDYDGEYYLFTKKGTDLDVLESECGFLEPEFSSNKLRFKGGTPVGLVDPNGNPYPFAMAICLPTEDPWPLLKAESPEADSFFWTFNGDTIAGHNIDSLWATEAGTYQVLVRGQYGCPGSAQIDIYFPFYPEFDLDLPPYCDTVLNPTGNYLPPLLTAPSTPTGGAWHWEYDFGPPNGFDLVSSGDSLVTIGPGKYKLVYTDTTIAPGIPGCVSEYEFDYTREAHPPEQPLSIDILGDAVLCEEGGANALLYLDEANFKPNFQAKPGYGPNTPYVYQWFTGFIEAPIANANDSALIRSEIGTYSVLVKDQYGCVGADSITVQKIPRTPAFEVFCTVVGGKRGRFNWEPVPQANSYQVSLDNGITWFNVDNNFYEVEDIRQYPTIMVKANLNNVCEESFAGESYRCAADVFPPNVFTPNNDGLNDFFKVGSLDLFSGSSITVFDRWGTVVFESDDYKNNWDGGDSPEGTYYYVINVNDPAESVYKGVVTLLR